MDSNVSDLLMGLPYRGSRDEYGRTRHPRCSLLLDAVMQGRPRASQSPLLQLPAEILAYIVDLLAKDKRALACLAMVNGDCRQLARCRQFAEVELDHSISSLKLLLQISKEAPSEAQQSLIGACVRKAKFKPQPHYFSALPEELHELLWRHVSEYYSDRQQEEFKNTAEKYHENLRKVTANVAASAMPNLEVLIWRREHSSLDQHFFNKLSRSTIKHLMLDKLFMDEPWIMQPPLTPEAWPLRSLHLDVSVRIRRRFGPGAVALEAEKISQLSTFIATFLQLCAPTLESLDLCTSDLHAKTSISFGTNSVWLPNLYFLRLGYIVLDAPAFLSLMSSTLRHLELSTLPAALCGNLLHTCGAFQNLESFIVPALPIKKETRDPTAKFPMQHKHIQKLYVHERAGERSANAYLDRCIIPVLGQDGFSNLRSLSLSWVGDDTGDAPLISGIALAAIGMIGSLEQLCLGSKNMNGFLNQWLVDHTELLCHFRGLCRLRKFALVCDTYKSPFPHHHATYYTSRIVQEQEEIDAEARQDLPMDEVDTQERLQLERRHRPGPDLREVNVWERAHRNRMLTVAEEYGAVLPQLEWMFCGQRPMGFNRPADSRPKAIPLTHWRDDCHTFLEKTFGISNDHYGEAG